MLLVNVTGLRAKMLDVVRSGVIFKAMNLASCKLFIFNVPAWEGSCDWRGPA